MTQVLPIRVLRTPTPEEKLSSIADYLEPHGVVKYTEGGEGSGSVEFTKLGTASGMTPTLDSGELSFSYDARHKQWTCISTLYGTPLKFHDPKLFISNVLSMENDAVGAKIQFLRRAQYYWGRYAGDPHQFAYALSVDQVNQGHMSLATNRKLPVFAKWDNTLDLKFSVCFSAVQGPLGPVYGLDFAETGEPRFELSTQGIESLINTLTEQREQSHSFLVPLLQML